MLADDGSEHPNGGRRKEKCPADSFLTKTIDDSLFARCRLKEIAASPAAPRNDRVVVYLYNVIASAFYCHCERSEAIPLDVALPA